MPGQCPVGQQNAASDQEDIRILGVDLVTLPGHQEPDNDRYHPEMEDRTFINWTV